MAFELKYRAGTKHGRDYPHWRFGRRATYAAADACRMHCAHPGEIEVVAVGAESAGSSTQTGQTGLERETMAVAKREPDRANESDSLAHISTTAKGA